MSEQAGRELDELVAEKVFNGPKEHADWYWWKQTCPEWPKDQPSIYAGPKFSTDIAQAMEVWEKVEGECLHRLAAFSWQAIAKSCGTPEWDPGHNFEACGCIQAIEETHCLAICHASLKKAEAAK